MTKEEKLRERVLMVIWTVGWITIGICMIRDKAITAEQEKNAKLAQYE